MSALKGRVKRLWRAEMPAAVERATLIFYGKFCRDWIAVLTGASFEPFTPEQEEAVKLWHEWKEAHGQWDREKIQEHMNKPEQPAGLLALFAKIAEDAPEAGQARRVLTRWVQRQQAAGLDPTVELTRLRDDVLFAHWGGGGG